MFYLPRHLIEQHAHLVLRIEGSPFQQRVLLPELLKVALAGAQSRRRLRLRDCLPTADGRQSVSTSSTSSP